MTARQCLALGVGLMLLACGDRNDVAARGDDSNRSTRVRVGAGAQDAPPRRRPQAPAGWRAAGTMKGAHGSNVVVVRGDLVLAIGGQDAGSDEVFADVIAFDAASNAWRARAPLPTPRASAGAVALDDGRIVVAGGLGGGRLDAVEVYDPKAEVWSRAAPMPGARTEPTLVELPDHTVALLGGYTEGGETIERVDRYDPRVDTWTALPPLSPSRDPSAVLVVGQALLVIGGYAPDGNTHLGLSRLTLGTSTWVDGPDPPERSNGRYVLLADGGILAIGGVVFEQHQPERSVELVQRYDAAGLRWSDLAALPEPRTSFSGSELPDGSVLVAGGEDLGARTLQSTWVLAPGGAAWTSGPPLPEPRSHHDAAVLSDGSVLLIGGWRGGILGTEVHDAIRLAPG